MNFSKVNFGKNTGLKSDRANEDTAIKYYTTNWYKDPKPENGINFTEGFGISQGFIDTESRISRGQITNPRIRQDLGTAPINLGGISNAGPLLSGQISNTFKGCDSADTDGKFYERQFYELTENPNHTQAGNGLRQGIDTRMISKQIYKK
jgi:hypothetical protein